MTTTLSNPIPLIALNEVKRPSKMSLGKLRKFFWGVPKMDGWGVPSPILLNFVSLFGLKRPTFTFSALNVGAGWVSGH